MKTNFELLFVRRNVILFLLAFCLTNVYAQEDSKYFIEVSAGKTSVTKSLFFDQTDFKINFLNGIRIGRLLGEYSEIFVSVQKESVTIDHNLAGIYTSHRHQFGVGYNRELYDGNKFKVLWGGELLLNYNKYSGYYASDSPFIFIPLDDLTTIELGAATQLQINYAINSRLAVVLNTRVGIYNRTESTVREKVIDQNLYRIYEPVNFLALRVNI